MIKTTVTSNSTQRIYPPDLPIKTRRTNYDPVLELYDYKSTEHQIREQMRKKKTTLKTENPFKNRKIDTKMQKLNVFN